MHTEKTLLLSLLLFCIPTFTLSQQLEITYDAQSKAMKFTENGMVINKPAIKKGQGIILRVENYNNYLYEVEIIESYEEKKIGKNKDLFEGLQALSITNLTSQLMPASSFTITEPPDEEEVADVFIEDEKERRIYQLKKEATEKLSELVILTEDFAQTASKAEVYKKKEKLRGIALDQIQLLKYNTELSPTIIKEQSLDILKTALGDASITNISDVINNNKEETSLKELLNNNLANQTAYSEKIEYLKRLQNELTQLAPNRSDLMAVYFSIEKAVYKAPEFLEETNQTTNSISELITLFQNRNMAEVLKMWYEYEAIKLNDFTTTYQTQAKGDVTVFDIKFTLKDAASNTEATKEIKLAPLKIPVYGGIKINASVGLSFIRFFTQPKQYFIQQNKIVGQNGDSFLPVVTSFVHFYKQNAKAISFGGSLGIGIPIGGEEGLASTTFLLGPSLLFGQSDRFVLTTGIMGGKANRLTYGYKEGDIVTSNENIIPTKSIYELGYFIGLSFNITN